MKKTLLTAFLALGSFLVQAQTKGTNTLGLGLNFQNTKTDQTLNKSESKIAAFNVGYGYFLKENEKIGINVFLGMRKQGYATTGQEVSLGEWNLNSYGGSFTYQKYYGLIKKLYAHAGPNAGYNYYKTDDASQGIYSLGVNGGMSWFFSKRLALEADLLSANINYSKANYGAASGYSYTSSGFNLNSSGAVNDLAFKIYFLF